MKRQALDRLNRLAAAEEQFLRGEFLAPCLDGATLSIRLAGIVCRLQLRQPFTGWGLFTAESLTQARLKRKATLKEERGYRELFPRRELIAIDQIDGIWFGWPAHGGDSRFGVPRLIPLRFVDEVQRFDHLQTRFDGAQAFFEEIDSRADPATADYLRMSFARRLAPDRLERLGLTREERTAYAIAEELQRKHRELSLEDRVRETLTSAGAEFRSFTERGDDLRVEFSVDGQRHVSVVRKDDFSLQLAGICLNGEDGKFDLNSLVGVLREADGVLRIGADNRGMAEEQYWDIHPPQ
jgi:hypothetical protein